MIKKVKDGTIPVQTRTGLEGSTTLRLPFQDSRHMMVVKSALRTGRLDTQEIFLVFISE
jgi:hypothetical protein